MIRPATVEDIRTVYNLVRAYFDEAVEKRKYKIVWDEERVVIQLGNWLWDHESSLSFIADDGAGVILGKVSETWFGKNLMAQPFALYVKPEDRNGILARSLIQAMEKRAVEKGALYSLWDFQTGLTDPSLMSGFMEKLGYTYQGPIYVKEFQPCRQ